MKNIICSSDVDDVRTFWHSYGPVGGTEVVEIIDDRGARSILIKMTKSEYDKRTTK